MRITAFTDAAMLGQQSANWHEKATHSRGYADNDNTAFGLWVSLWAAECLRLLKPGGHLIAFGGTRTWHRLACGVEDVGFEVRDSLAWIYATGVPKSLDVGRAVAKTNGAQETTAAARSVAAADRTRGANTTGDGGEAGDGAGWDGWYTGVKPALEPIVLARKPITGTVAENVLAYGTGALNVAAARLDGGRWPTNVFLDEGQADRLDRGLDGRGSRYFFVAKPSSHERVKVGGVAHPTVKPLALMRELIKLVTPAGGLILDPFAGSGTTVEACIVEDRACLAIERDSAFLPLIQARLARQTDAAVRLGGGHSDLTSGANASVEPDTLF